MKLKMKYLLIFFLLFSNLGPTYGKQPDKLLVFEDVESEIFLRPWRSKGMGKLVKKEIITVIRTTHDTGNIIILKWNKSHDNFDTEIYTSENIDDITSVWKLDNKENRKILTHQHGDFYMTQEKIPGKNGGVTTQFFTLK